MRSGAISARNRANARKSTGPKSAAGKAAVSQNARRHGATAQPEPEDISRWLRIILDDPEVMPDVILAGGARAARALDLAEAEARLVVCDEALHAFEAGLGDPDDAVHGYLRIAAQINAEFRYPGCDRESERIGNALLREMAQQTIDEKMRGGKRHRLLKRYLREARAARRRAFSAWIAVLDEVNRGAA